MILEGNVSVKAAILGGRRTVTKLMIDQNKKDRDTAFIIRSAKQRGIPVELMERETIDAMAEGRTHGGVLCEAGGRTIQSAEDCLKEETPLLFLVEGVEDPFNLGYIMRTLYSAGCSGLILSERNWENAEKVIIRSSAGASEYLNVVMEKDLAGCLRKLKKQGVRCYAAMRQDAIVYDEADYCEPVLIAVGGEMRGLSASVRQEIDTNIFIPYANDFRNALNAASAAAVLSFEAARQRRRQSWKK